MRDVLRRNSPKSTYINLEKNLDVRPNINLEKPSLEKVSKKKQSRKESKQFEIQFEHKNISEAENFDQNLKTKMVAGNFEESGFVNSFTEIANNFSNTISKTVSNTIGSGIASPAFSTGPNFVLVGNQTQISGLLATSSSVNFKPSFGDFREVVGVFSGINQQIDFYASETILFANVVCSLVLQIIGSVAYKTYQMILSVVEICQSLPRQFNQLQHNLIGYVEGFLEELLSILKSSETREMWFLNQKLVARSRFLEIQKLLTSLHSSLFGLTSQFYLLIMALVVVGGLSFSSNFSLSSAAIGNTDESQLASNSKNKEGSLISRVFDKNSATLALSALSFEDQTPEIQIASLNNQVDTTDAYLYLPKITEHQVQEGQGIEEIADIYNVKSETITANNKPDETGKLPEKLKIPFKNGLIYTLSRDIGVDDIGKAFEVDPNLIYSENEGDLNRDISKFEKGTEILIPDVNFEIVEKAKGKLEIDVVDITKPAIQSNQKGTQTKFNITPTQKPANNGGKTFENQVSEQTNNLGFIWPTTGRISRCVVGSHVACDISNKDAPAVYAVASGKVIAGGYGYEPGGYGNAILIDHGDGVVTLYAHLSEVYVSVGDTVGQGKSIGQMGRTGRSTGIHLHFEVRVNGAKKNPLSYLPK